MSFKLSFERKFGWSELFAALALLISIASLWYTRAQIAVNLPDLTVESRAAISLVSKDRTQDKEVIAALPFMVVNRGGRSVSLLRIERDDVGPLLHVSDGKVKENNDLIINFSLLEESPDGKDVIPGKVISAEVRPLSLPQDINSVIESGHAKSFILVLRVKDPAKASTLGLQFLFSCRAVFSDGSTHRIAQGIGFPQ